MLGACAGRSARAPPHRPFQLHAVVAQPLTASDVGRISLRPLGAAPVAFEWSPVPRGLDASGSEATAAAPGRYHVAGTDAEGARADIALDVAPTFADAVVVRAYDVTPASGGRARDGSVRAVGDGVDAGWRFLWTCGAETDGPTLQDVPSGTYAAVALPNEGGVPTTVHACAPARVPVHAPAWHAGGWQE